MNIKQNNKWQTQLWALLFLGLIGGYGLTALPAAAAPFAYVADTHNNTVLVIDTQNNTVVSMIWVLNPQRITITPNGEYAYVSNIDANLIGFVTVINTTTNSVVNIIQVGNAPLDLAITPNGLYVYVANSYSASVSVIDTTTNNVVSTIPVEGPRGVAITPDGLHAYVTDVVSNTVLVIDTATNIVESMIPVGSNQYSGPRGLAITPDGRQVYVTNSSSSDEESVSVISTITNTMVDTIPVGQYPSGVAIAPDGQLAYITKSVGENGFVVVIDTTTNEIVTSIPVGSSPVDIAFTPDGKRAYVANSRSASVSVIDTTTNTVMNTIPVGIPPYGPSGVAITPVFSFYGFNSPVDNPPLVNNAKAGSVIPVKWRIADYDGTSISDPISFNSLESNVVGCESFSGYLNDPVEEYGAGSSGLQYLGDGNWQFNWKTSKSYAKQCRIMVLKLSDGSSHTAKFKFK